MKRGLLFIGIAALSACTPTIRSSAPSPRPNHTALPAGAKPSATPIVINAHAERSGNQYTTIVERKAGRTIYALRAESSTLRGQAAGSYDITFQRPHVTFYDRTGKTLVADAPQALVIERDKRVTMTGGVHARATDGTTLQCRTLVYDGATERLHGSGGVHMRNPQGAELTGDTLEGDIRLDNVTIRGSGG